MRVDLLLSELPLVGLLGWAAASDLRRRRIPNVAVLAIALTGVARSAVPGGPATPGGAVVGMAVGFALLLPVYLLGGMGAGDVKLMAGVGAWVGPWGVAGVCAVAAVVGMVAAVGRCAVRGKVGALAVNAAGIVMNPRGSVAGVDGTLPYAVLVLVGAVVVLGRAVS